MRSTGHGYIIIPQSGVANKTINDGEVVAFIRMQPTTKKDVENISNPSISPNLWLLLDCGQIFWREITPFHIVIPQQTRSTQDAEQNRNRAQRSLRRPIFPLVVRCETISFPLNHSFPLEGKGTQEITVWKTAFYFAASKFILRSTWYFTLPGRRRQPGVTHSSWSFLLQQLYGSGIPERHTLTIQKAIVALPVS